MKHFLRITTCMISMCVMAGTSAVRTFAESPENNGQVNMPSIIYKNVSTATAEDAEQFKKRVITNYISQNPRLTADDIDFDASTVTTENVNYAQNIMQSTKIDVNIVLKDKAKNKASALPKAESTKPAVVTDSSSAAVPASASANSDASAPQADNTISYTESAAVEVQNDMADKPVVSLKANEVTVYLGSAYNYTSNIGNIYSSSNMLPAITETDNIDTSKEGTYTVDITATSQNGQTTKAGFTVNVVKSPEQIAKEEAERKAAEQAEAERKAAEEAAAAQAQAEAEQRASAEAAAQAADAQAAAVQQASTPSVQTASGSATGNTIVSIARSWVGVGKYVWGGSNPATGTDCSGFTQYVYAQVGINLNRTAASQAANGTPVSAAQAQPGDLVLWTGHAAIYSGGGMVINALNPSLGIQEVPLSYSGGSGTFLGYYHVPGVN